jgi:tetratricopeptide (TPR) repeat protein
MELCKAAKQAKNWNDLLKYASEILEIDPKNVDAWLDKALATGSLSSGYSHRLEEARGYLQQAAELSPDDARISEIKTIIEDVQFRGYINLALERNKAAVDLFNYNIVTSISIGFLGEAMGNFIAALKVKPNDPYTLQSIKTVNETAKSKGIQWTDPEVRELLLKVENTLREQAVAVQRAKAQQDAARRLLALKQKLHQREVELAKLNQKKRGFFVNMEIEDVQNEMKKISLEINKLESTIQKPKTDSSS